MITHDFHIKNGMTVSISAFNRSPLGIVDTEGTHM